MTVVWIKQSAFFICVRHNSKYFQMRTKPMQITPQVHALQHILQTLRQTRESGEKASRDWDKLPGILAAAYEDLFIKSYLHDTLGALLSEHQANPEGSLRQWRLLDAALQRLEYLPCWDDHDNMTIDAIRSGKIPFDAIKPFVRHPWETYEKVYQDENEKCRRFLAENMDRIRQNVEKNKDRTCLPFEYRPGKEAVQHWVRKNQAVGNVQWLMALLHSVLPEEARLWIDVGCGVGRIPNAVDISLGPLQQWRIIGCDLQADRIRRANLMATRNRKFFPMRVEDIIQQGVMGASSPGLVSMFEFIEHLEDPLRIIQSMAQLGCAALLIGTPLEQKWRGEEAGDPDPIHLWGFGRQAVETMMQYAGLALFFSNESRVGAYAQGLDWLSVCAVSPSVRRCINETQRL